MMAFPRRLHNDAQLLIWTALTNEGEKERERETYCYKARIAMIFSTWFDDRLRLAYVAHALCDGEQRSCQVMKRYNLDIYT